MEVEDQEVQLQVMVVLVVEDMVVAELIDAQVQVIHLL